MLLNRISTLSNTMPKKVTCEICGTEFDIPDDVVDGELVSCPTCGQKYQVVLNSGSLQLKKIEVEAEDWGE